VGRIRYIGVLLYDAEKILQKASVENPGNLYQSHLDLFLDPNDPAIVEEARKQGITENFIKAAQDSPIYKMAVKWKIAFPLHPEYRTLPMVWYTPPLSPIQEQVESGKIGVNGIIPDPDDLRIPVKYLANMFTAGEEKPVRDALGKMLTMRSYMRSKIVDNKPNPELLEGSGLTPEMTEEMYRYMAIANYEDRYVIPITHKEFAFDAFGDKSACGFTDGEGCGSMETRLKDLFGGI
jgi:nitrate reductase beta subunit